MGYSGRLKHPAATPRYYLNADIRLCCNICRTGRLQVTTTNAERA